MMTPAAFKKNVLAAAIAAIAGLASIASGTAHAGNNLSFRMQPSPGAAVCMPNATGYVTVSPLGSVENMHVEVRGLPPHTNFDFFVIQVPNAPFGLSWYEGDIETDANGVGVGDFVGRFNEETFIVAPGSDVAPSVHKTWPFPDAAKNPATGPVHTYHLGLWFNSAVDAGNAGCPNTVTPFNGEHKAGIQVLNTAQYPKDKGPLLKLKP
jgi:hypothetical protein